MSRLRPSATAWLMWLFVAFCTLSVIGPIILGGWLYHEANGQRAYSAVLLRSAGIAIALLGPVVLASLCVLSWTAAAFLVAAARYLWFRTESGPGNAKAVASARPSKGATQLAESIRRAVAERKWTGVEELLRELQELDRELAKELTELAHREQEAHAKELREALRAAREQNNPQAVLDVRDRLVSLLSVDERQDLDREIAQWSIAYLRDALHEGRARELIDVIERMVETFGESTAEGMELKNALPILRRSAGRCPDCGEPYDISLERCPDCERKLRARKARSGTLEPGRNGGSSRREPGDDANVDL